MEELREIFIELFGKEDGEEFYKKHIEVLKKLNLKKPYKKDNELVKGGDYEEKHIESL